MFLKTNFVSSRLINALSYVFKDLGGFALINHFHGVINKIIYHFNDTNI
jgi:hypothetical protein